MRTVSDLDGGTFIIEDAPPIPATDTLTIRWYRLVQERLKRAWQEVATAKQLSRLGKIRDYLEKRFDREDDGGRGGSV